MATAEMPACRAVCCPFCGTFRVRRRRRTGIRDRVATLLCGCRYRCVECHGRFRQRLETNHSVPVRAAQSAVHEQTPVARVTIAAPTHEQLEQILLALRQVVRCVNGFTGSAAEDGAAGACDRL